MSTASPKQQFGTARGTSVIDRIMMRIEVDPDTGCWLWPGGKTLCGYGRIRETVANGGEKVLTHRATYERFVGPIPEAMELDHSCKVRHCCNPEHCEPVTHAENMARGFNATKTHCVNGHEFTPENTYVNPNRPTARNCRQCTADAQERYQARKNT